MYSSLTQHRHHREQLQRFQRCGRVSQGGDFTRIHYNEVPTPPPSLPSTPRCFWPIVVSNFYCILLEFITTRYPLLLLPYPATSLPLAYSSVQLLLLPNYLQLLTLIPSTVLLQLLDICVQLLTFLLSYSVKFTCCLSSHNSVLTLLLHPYSVLL